MVIGKRALELLGPTSHPSLIVDSPPPITRFSPEADGGLFVAYFQLSDKIMRRLPNFGHAFADA